MLLDLGFLTLTNKIFTVPHTVQYFADTIPSVGTHICLFALTGCIPSTYKRLEFHQFLKYIIFTFIAFSSGNHPTSLLPSVAVLPERYCLYYLSLHSVCLKKIRAIPVRLLPHHLNQLVTPSSSKDITVFLFCLFRS